MKLILQYIKGHRRLLITGAVTGVVFIGSFMLYHLPVMAVIYPMLISAAICMAVCIFDFVRVSREHKALQQIKSVMDVTAEKFPVTENVTEKDYQEIIRLLSEEYISFRSETKCSYADMVEYYTVWVHQIKTPIASMRLHLQNEDSVLTRKLASDLHRIEQYVEMVLTFLRLNSESTDYVFKEYDVDKILQSVIKKFSSDFIERKLSLAYKPLNKTVVTDEKWLSFVIEQVISNALKYTMSGSITISLVDGEILRIEDTGIGIAPEDIPRIFENGYTGRNGRADHRASGIGLYLCKRICLNLGHEISASSTVDAGTKIDIDLSGQKLEIE